MSVHSPDIELGDVALAERETKREPRLPPLYALIMHNDDYTTMEFVVWVLVSVLGLAEAKAISLMLDIHQKGLAKVAVLPKELAEMKREQIMQFAEQEEFPLLVTLEVEG